MQENNSKIEFLEPNSISGDSGNKKPFVIAMIILVLLLTAAIFAWMFFGKNNSANKKSEVTNFGTIRDVMNTNKLYACKFKISDGGQSFSSDILIHGNKFHTVIKMGNDSMHELFDGNVQYAWKDSTKKGFYVERSCFAKKGKNIDDIVMETADVVSGKIECTLTDDENFSKPKGIDLINNCDKF